jgi:hypothetical protein
LQLRSREVLAQAFAFNVFGGDEVMPILFANLMNGQNVGVIEAGGGISFALEAAEPILVLGDIAVEQFDGDLAAQARVKGKIDFTHAARAEQRANLIPAESSTWLNHDKS